MRHRSVVETASALPESDVLLLATPLTAETTSPACDRRQGDDFERANVYVDKHAHLG
jgi:hypothetical protein